MTVSAVSQSMSPQQASPTAAKTQSLNTDFNVFLKLLTTQARHQDPLNPIDATEFSSQLATFSLVEQSLKSNEFLAQIAGQSSGSDLLGAGHILGKTAEYRGPFAYDGTPVSLRFDPAASDTVRELVIENAFGSEIDRVRLSPSQTEAVWHGASNVGIAADAGTYKARIETPGDAGQSDTSIARVLAQISSVTLQAGERAYNVGQDTWVTEQDIVALHE